MKIKGYAAAMGIGLISGVGANGHTPSARQLNVCHAGSLTAAFVEVEKAFTSTHPGVSLKDSAGGSLSLARQLAAGTLPCDVYATADDLNIELMLKPAGLADYTIVFASGRMVLAYLATDPKAQALPVVGEFNPPSSIPEVGQDWYETLLAPGVRISGAHPFSDPGAYRSHLIFELAQAFYGKPGLQNALLDHYTVIPADPTDPARSAVIGRDYNFYITYEHGALGTAKGNPAYRFARFPDQIGLSADASNGDYGRASITIPGLGVSGAPASVVIPGSRTAWGVTIVKNSPNQAQAEAFLEMLLGAVGTGALKAHGPTPVSPATVSPDDHARLPAPLQPLVRAIRK